LAFGFDAKIATGTSLLAQLLPVGLLGVREYWRRGEVAVVPGLWIALGLLVGVFFGARLTGLMSPQQMKRAYGIFLIVVGVYFLLPPGGAGSTPVRPQAAVEVPADQDH